MRIAIMGSGGVGGYFGARLVKGGADVHFVARGAQPASSLLRARPASGAGTLARRHGLSRRRGHSMDRRITVWSKE